MKAAPRFIVLAFMAASMIGVFLWVLFLLGGGRRELGLVRKRSDLQARIADTVGPGNGSGTLASGLGGGREQSPAKGEEGSNEFGADAEIERSSGGVVGVQNEWMDGQATHLKQSFVQGELVSTVTYYADGSRWQEYTLNGGKITGMYRSWLPTGELAMEAVYVDGRLEGRFIAWHPGGIVASTGDYSGGQKKGVWREYRATGALQAELHYENGQLEGVCRMWDAQGALDEASGVYRGGKKISDQ